MSDYHSKGKDRSKSYHIIISKQDGSVTREIFIPFKTINTPIVVDGDKFIASYSYPIRLSHDAWHWWIHLPIHCITMHRMVH